MRYTVSIKVTARASKYWACLETVAGGKVHKRTLEQERKATINSNMLQGTIEAVKRLNQPCMLDIYIESDFIVAAWKQGWVRSWSANGWKNAKGNEVRNREQWEELLQLLDRHAVRFFEWRAER